MSTPGDIYVTNPVEPASGDKVIVDRSGVDGAIDLKDLLFSKGKVRVVSGTTDTILATDVGHNLIYTNVAGCAITWPDTLDQNFQCTIFWQGTAAPVVTPDTDTIYEDGVSAATVSPSAIGKGMYMLKFSATEILAVN